VSLEFLSPSAGALARSPMERAALAAGAHFERRGGWNVAVAFDGLEPERERCRLSVGFADLSHLGKLEIQAGGDDLAALVESCTGGAAIAPGGRAVRVDGAWWCPYTATRALVICDPDALEGLRPELGRAAASRPGHISVVDVTTAYAAVAVAGPLSGELFARFTALDLRPHVTPVHAWRPGSVARTPGAILREADDRYLMIFGAALGHYVWTTVADAAAGLGGGPVGLDALGPVPETQAEETLHA
jgi:glycine cleavage system aminomethyltransferase T